MTHYFKILDYIDVDEVYILKNGELLKHGGKELIEKVKKMDMSRLNLVPVPAFRKL